MSTEPFISANIYCGDRPVNCLICDEVICKNDVVELTVKNWTT